MKKGQSDRNQWRKRQILEVIQAKKKQVTDLAEKIRPLI